MSSVLTETVGGGSGAENFSYEEVISTKEVTIPLYQQMVVFDGIIVDGTLNVDGTLVLT